MDLSTLRYEVVDHVAWITFTRPEKRNTFSAAVSADIIEAFDCSDGDDEVRVVVMTGEGRSFCAGQDLDEGFIVRGGTRSDSLEAYLQRAGDIGGVPRDSGGYTSLRIAASTKPVIVAVNGAAVGIGATMILPADIRIAGESTRFGFVFTRRGLVPEAASSWFLPRTVGISKAMEWVATGRLIGAQEALQSGLVSYVVDDDSLLDKAREIAREIVENASPVAVALARKTLWAMLEARSPWEAHAIESQAVYGLGADADVSEGVTSFFEKRMPTFPLRVSVDLPDYAPEWPERPATL